MLKNHAQRWAKNWSPWVDPGVVGGGGFPLSTTWPTAVWPAWAYGRDAAPTYGPWAHNLPGVTSATAGAHSYPGQLCLPGLNAVSDYVLRFTAGYNTYSYGWYFLFGLSRKYILQIRPDNSVKFLRDAGVVDSQAMATPSNNGLKWDFEIEVLNTGVFRARWAMKGAGLPVSWNWTYTDTTYSTAVVLGDTYGPILTCSATASQTGNMIFDSLEIDEP